MLPNGLLVVTEQMPHVRSAALGIWLRTGSRQENPQKGGVSHFIEHMVFKGTKHRTAEQIARVMDSVGGHLDAFTAKECVSFNTVVLDENIQLAFDVLSDLVLNPLFDSHDIARERSVVLEEIKSEQDNPDYLLHELFTGNFWKDHPLGKPIIGTKQSVASFNRNSLLDEYSQFYQPGNMVISAAGNIHHDRIMELVEHRFRSIQPPESAVTDIAPSISSHITLKNKQSLEQVHLVAGLPSCPIPHRDRYAWYILNTILGGGMSSRLFQNIREKQGLAYSVYSDLATYRDSGCLMIYVGTSSETVKKVIRSMMHELRDLKENGVTREELRRAKDQLKGSLMLGLESTGSRMSNIARQQMYFGRFFTLDEIIQGIEAVKNDDLSRIMLENFRPDSVSLTVLGRLNGLRVTRKDLVF
ncbi:MAG: peptidase M16 [Acidobacteria bacterium RIFCSPLOWO2_12_FULL_54_10]|nr:MAG: peptidase M16 [Acidobacteria bacterium RIFCSPLOWO2_12_FULL_54_10]